MWSGEAPKIPAHEKAPHLAGLLFACAGHLVRLWIVLRRARSALFGCRFLACCCPGALAVESGRSTAGRRRRTRRVRTRCLVRIRWCAADVACGVPVPCDGSLSGTLAPGALRRRVGAAAAGRRLLAHRLAALRLRSVSGVWLLLDGVCATTNLPDSIASVAIYVSFFMTVFSLPFLIVVDRTS